MRPGICICIQFLLSKYAMHPAVTHLPMYTASGLQVWHASSCNTLTDVYSFWPPSMTCLQLQHTYRCIQLLASKYDMPPAVTHLPMYTASGLQVWHASSCNTLTDVYSFWPPSMTCLQLQHTYRCIQLLASKYDMPPAATHLPMYTASGLQVWHASSCNTLTDVYSFWPPSMTCLQLRPDTSWSSVSLSGVNPASSRNSAKHHLWKRMYIPSRFILKNSAHVILLRRKGLVCLPCKKQCTSMLKTHIIAGRKHVVDILWETHLVCS